jgi:hypothetical protein
MRFGSWNVRSMYWAGSLRAVVEEIAKYKSDLVSVQKVRWVGDDTESAGEYTFFIFFNYYCFLQSSQYTY